MALLLAAGAVLSASACGSNGGSAEEQKTPSASASPSADPQEQEKERALTAYRQMWEAKTRTYAAAKLDPAVQKFAGDKALSNIKITLVYHQDHGTVMKGEPQIAPKVTGIDLTAKPMKATLQDCVDSSNYIEVDAKSGKPVPVGDGPRRHVYTATAVTVGGQWRVWNTAIDRGRTC